MVKLRLRGELMEEMVCDLVVEGGVKGEEFGLSLIHI